MIHYRLRGTGIQCVSKTGGFSMNITFDDNLITGNKTIEYTNFHFQEEEDLQKKVSYPELAAHHAKHEEFKKSIQELYDYLNENEGPDDQFVEQVKRNVVDWLFQHIKTFDRSVAEYIHLKDNSDRL